jgi:hypothetical protein
LHLPIDAVIYRWGVRASVDAISAGSRIRVATDSEGKTVWQLDIAETRHNESILKAYDADTGIITTMEGRQYLVSTSTRFYIDGFPVLPVDLLSDEKIELEYTIAPPPTGNVLISVNAHSAAKPPFILASAIPLHNRLVVTGKTSGNNIKIYIWKGLSCQPVPVNDIGRFNLPLSSDFENEDYLNIVALDMLTGGVSGVTLQSSVHNDSNAATALDAVNRVVGLSSGMTPAQLSGVPLTRSETAAVLAVLMNWPKVSGWPLSFADEKEIPASYRPAVAEARARGIFRGYSDGNYRPMATLNRAEAAVVFAAVLRDTGA